MHEPVIPAENTRCHRCGGLLEMRVDPDHMVCPPQDILDLVESSFKPYFVSREVFNRILVDRPVRFEASGAPIPTITKLLEPGELWGLTWL